MNILIVGAGLVGSSLAEELSHNGNNVSVIDSDPVECEKLSEKMDVMVVCGHGSKPSVLELAGIKTMDMVVAVTNSDEMNIAVCAISRIYGVNRRIARIRESEFFSQKAKLDISKLGITKVIAPEKVSAENIMQYIESPGATGSANFGGGYIYIRGYKITEEMPIANRSVKEIKEMATPHVLLAVTIIRNGKARIPKADDIVKVGDELFSIFPSSSLETYLELVGHKPKSKQRIIIFGDSQIAIELALMLEKKDVKVTLVEPNEEQGKKVADILNNTEILYGDCTEQEFLQEIMVEDADFFIAANKKREDNIMAALLAKSEKAKEVIAVYHKPMQAALFNSFGIDHLICLHAITTREIMEEVKQGQIGSTISTTGGGISAMRFIVEKDSKITEKPLLKIWEKIRKDAIIGAFIRDNTIQIPQGSDTLEAGDDVVVITNGKHINTIKDLFNAP